MLSKRLKKAVIICGGICSGKTYTANLVSKKIEYPIASFGGYLKSYSEKNSLPIGRKALQDIGEEFIKTKPEQFLNDVINYSIGNSDSIIIEGVRHISIFHLIKSLAETTTSIFIEADNQTRYERYCSRINDSDGFKTFEQFIILDKHSVEKEIQSLKPLCDIILNSTEPFNENLFAHF